MIRRETASEWILITQIEHARIAHVVAELWRDVNPVLLDDALMFSIEHHDDGWNNWDSNPKLAGETNRPLSFTEMSIFDSSKIWSDGIEVCAQHSAQAGLLSSQHFAWLAEHISNNDGKPSEEKECARHFIQQQETNQSNWMRKTSTSYLDSLPSKLEVLQLMDRFSLWICSDPSEQPASPMRSNNHPTFSLKQSDHISEHNRVEVHNFPGLTSAITIEAKCKRIPIEKTQNSNNLAQAIIAQHTDTIDWQLLPI